jgi:SLT domain-containing protein
LADTRVAQAHVELTARERELLAAFDRVNRELQKTADEHARASRRMENQSRGPIRAVDNLNEKIGDTRRTIARLNASSKIDPKVSSEGLKVLDDYQKKADSLSNEDVQVLVHTVGRFDAELRDVERGIHRVNGQNVTIPVNAAGVAPSIASLTALKAEADRINGQTVHVDVETRGVNETNKQLRTIGDSLDSIRARTARGSLPRVLFAGLPVLLPAIVQLGGALVAMVAPLQSIGGEAAILGSTAGEAALSVTSLGTAFAGVAAVIAPLAISMQANIKAAQQVATSFRAAERAHDPAALDSARKQYDQLTASQKRFVPLQVAAGKQLEHLNNEFAKPSAQIYGSALNVAFTTLHSVNDELKQGAGFLADWSSQAEQLLRTTRFQDLAQDVVGLGNDILRSLGGPALDALDAIRAVIQASIPGAELLSRDFASLIERVSQFILQSERTGTLQDTLTKSAVVAERLITIFGRVGLAVLLFFRGSSSASGALLDDLDRLSSNFLAFMQEAEQSGQLATWAQQAHEQFSTLIDVFWQLGRVIVGVFKAALPAGNELDGTLRDFLKNLADAVNSVQGQNDLRKFFDDAIPAAEAFGRTIVDLVKALFELNQSFGGSGFLSAVIGAIDTLIRAFEAVPGPIQALLIQIAALNVAASLFGLSFVGPIRAGLGIIADNFIRARLEAMRTRKELGTPMRVARSAEAGAAGGAAAGAGEATAAAAAGSKLDRILASVNTRLGQLRHAGPAAFAGLAAAVRNPRLVIEGLTKVVGGVAPAFSRAALGGLRFAKVAGPIGLAIGAIIGVFDVLKDNTLGLRTALEHAWDRMSGALSNLRDAFAKAFSGHNGELIRGVAHALGQILEIAGKIVGSAIVLGLIGTFDGIALAINGIAKAVDGALTALDFLIGKFKDVSKAVPNLPNISLPGAPGGLGSIFKAVGGVFRAHGGPVPGSGRGDKVRANLEPGEYVVRRPVVEALGQRFFDTLNFTGRMPLALSRNFQGGGSTRNLVGDQNAINSGLTGLRSSVSTFDDDLQDSLKQIRDLTKEVFDAFQQTVKEATQKAREAASANAEKMRQKVSDETQKMQEASSKHFEKLRASAQDNSERARQAIESNTERAQRRADEQFSKMANSADRNTTKIKKTVRDKTQDAATLAYQNSRRLGINWGKGMDNATAATADGYNKILRMTEKSLKSLGAKNTNLPHISISAGKPDTVLAPDGRGGSRPTQTGGRLGIGRLARQIARRAAGGMRLMGAGLADSIPILAAPGEAVINRHQEAAIENISGVPGIVDNVLNAVHRPHMMPMIPGFQAGGRLSGVHAGIAKAAQAVLAKFPGLQVTSTTGGGHAANSYHYKGEAVDIASGDYGYMTKAAAWIKQKMGRNLTEGIHNPNLSVKDGKNVAPSFWGTTTWANHANHIHLAVAGALGKLASSIGATADRVPRIRATGGVVGTGIQAGLDKVRRAANSLIDKNSLTAAGTENGHQVVKGGLSLGQVRAIINRAMGIVGVPRPLQGAWRSMAIARARFESGFNPNAQNNWDKNAAAGIPSKGLFQTIDPTFRAYAVGRFRNILAPLDNTLAAFKYMLARYGSGNWARALAAMNARRNVGYASGGRVGGVRRAQTGTRAQSPEQVAAQGQQQTKKLQQNQQARDKQIQKEQDAAQKRLERQANDAMKRIRDILTGDLKEIADATEKIMKNETNRFKKTYGDRFAAIWKSLSKAAQSGTDFSRSNLKTISAILASADRLQKIANRRVPQRRDLPDLRRDNPNTRIDEREQSRKRRRSIQEDNDAANAHRKEQKAAKNALSGVNDVLNEMFNNIATGGQAVFDAFRGYLQAGQGINQGRAQSTQNSFEAIQGLQSQNGQAGLTPEQVNGYGRALDFANRSLRAFLTSQTLTVQAVGVSQREIGDLGKRMSVLARVGRATGRDMSSSMNTVRQSILTAVQTGIDQVNQFYDQSKQRLDAQLQADMDNIERARTDALARLQSTYDQQTANAQSAYDAQTKAAQDAYDAQVKAFEDSQEAITRAQEREQRRRDQLATSRSLGRILSQEFLSADDVNQAEQLQQQLADQLQQGAQTEQGYRQQDARAALDTQFQQQRDARDQQFEADRQRRDQQFQADTVAINAMYDQQINQAQTRYADALVALDQQAQAMIGDLINRAARALGISPGQIWDLILGGGTIPKQKGNSAGDMMVDGIRASRASIKRAGSDLMDALARGIDANADSPADALQAALRKMARLLPHSDAEIGPLSNLTGSGEALWTTFSDAANDAAKKAILLAPALPDPVANLNTRSATAPISAARVDINHFVHLDASGLTEEQKTQLLRDLSRELAQSTRENNATALSNPARNFV